MIHQLILSLLASIKTDLSEFRAVKFAIFCVKKRETPKYLLVKSKHILYMRFANLQFSFLSFIAVALVYFSLRFFGAQIPAKF